MTLKVPTFEYVSELSFEADAWAAARLVAIEQTQISDPRWYEICWFVRPEDLLKAAEKSIYLITIEGPAEELFMAHEPFLEPDKSVAEAIGRRVLASDGVVGMNDLRHQMLLTRGPHVYNGLAAAWRPIDEWYWQ